MAQLCFDAFPITNCQNDSSENSVSDDSLLLGEPNSNDNKWTASDSDEAAFVVPHVTNLRQNGCKTTNVSQGWNEENWSLWRGGNIGNLNSTGNSLIQTVSISDDADADVPLLPNNIGFIRTSDVGTTHCHSLTFASVRTTAWQTLSAASVLCFIFMAVEIIGGYFAGSVAVMTDAAHLLSDLIGFLVSLSAVAFSQRPATKTFSFGFCRVEVLGAVVSTWIIWVLSFLFLYIAIYRIVVADFVINANTMIIVAFIGVVINIVMGVILHGACQLPHFHGHSHSAHQSLTECSDSVPELATHSHPTNINIRAAFIHVIGDLIQSVGVLTAAIIIKFVGPEAKIADPICTIISSLIVLTTTIPVLKDSGRILLEGFPPSLDYKAVLCAFQQIPHVCHAHSLHVWSLTAEKTAMSVHLAVDQNTDRDQVLQLALLCARDKFDIKHCTVQVEKYDATTFNSCLSCRPPEE